MGAEDRRHGLDREGSRCSGEPGGDPGRFGLDLGRLDLVLVAAKVGEDEPGRPGPNDEADDEEPPVELGVHHCDRVG